MMHVQNLSLPPSKHASRIRYARPVCLSYVTAQPDKLGALFDALREDFSQIAFLLRAAAQARVVHQMQSRS